MSKEISTEDEKLLKDSFTELKYVCDEIVKNPSSENCTKFINIVEKTPTTIFNYLFEYAIFPVQLHIYQHISKKTKLTTKVLIYLLKCMKNALSKIRVDSSTKFLEYSILLLKIVLEFENEKSIEGMSEDVKYEVVECLLSLYKNVDSTILHEIYDPLKRNNCHPQAVYFCTQVARHEQLLELRVKALKCLLVIFRIDGEEYADIDDAKLKFNIAENVTIMFPGIISTCHVIITSNLMIHHSLFIHAMQVFSRIVTLIFEFNSAVTINAGDFSSKMAEIITSHKPEDRSKSLHMSPRRTEKWYAEATEKLITCTKGLIQISGSLHWKVRFELVKSAHLMLVKCSSNIKAFSTTLVEILIISSCDNMDQVSQPARSHLKNLLEQDTLWSHQILEFLEENLCSLLDAIISSLNAADENILLSHLNLLNGYLNILNLPRVLKSFFHFRRLVNTLIKVIRFDPSSLNSFHELRIQELGVSDSCTINIQTISWKNSKYLNSQTDMTVKKICETISKKTEIESIAFYLMDIFETNIEDRKEVIYLINNIVLGSRREYSDEYFNIIKSILNIYLDPVYWSLPVDSSENDFFKSTPLTVIHSNILQICLLTEGIGNMAESLQKNFNPLLLRCLYSVIENAGSSNEFISSTGLETIKKITSCSGYSSVTELITDNVDYVTYHVSLKLRNLKDNKKVFDVLDVIILHCEQQSLAVLCDIIETLLRSSDILSDRFREGFLKVFRSFVRKLRKWFAPVFNEDMSALNESEEKHFKFLVTIDDYVNRNKKQNISSNNMLEKEIDLNEIFKTTDIDYLELEPSDEPNDEDFTPQELRQNVTEDDNEEKPIPQHIQLIVSVANRLVHVLPTKCVMDKIMILEIFMDTLLLLCENENQLLPVVHKLWSPLVNRFKYDNKDFLVLRRCFELLCVMAVTARDFIRSRTLKEVLPIINDFLSLSSADSKLKDKKSVYRMSQKYKLQHILLRELGHLSVYICLQEKELNSVLIAVTPYLSSKQPQPLQIACLDLFKIIAVEHFEFVWIHLLSVYAVENIFVSPNTFELNTVKIHKDENSEEYRKNVTSLFRSMN